MAGVGKIRKIGIAFFKICAKMSLQTAVVSEPLQPGSMEEENMAYKITDACVMCGTCADTCPLGIIAEGESTYVIDADQCVECGSCAAACPCEAIVQE